jgi:VWFA-related protein
MTRTLPALILFLGTIALAQDSVPTLRLSSRAVVVDVVVTDSKGHPVHNLKQSDFSVAESGKPETITHFEEHTPATPVLQPAPPKFPAGTFSNYSVAPQTGSINILLLDALNTPLEDQAFVRQEMLKYLKSPRPGAMAIFSLNSHLRLLQGFTTDPEVLRAIVNGKRPDMKASPVLNNASNTGDINAVAPVDPNAVIGDTSLDTPTSQATTDIIAANVKQFQAESSSFQLSIRTRVTLEALNLLGRYLGSLPGRKNLIWFADSFPINVLPDGDLRYPFAAAENYADAFRDTSNLLSRSQVSVYPIDARGLLGTNVLATDTTKVDTRFASAPGAAGAIDGHAETMLEQNTSGQSTMMLMAENTGGKAFINSNDLKKAVEQAMDAGANYYTLSYAPDNPDWKGDYRKIEVKLAEQGYKLAYRRGYFADDPNGVHSGTSAEAPGKQAVSFDPMRVAMLFGGPDPTEIVFSATVHPTTGTPEPNLAPGNRGDSKAGPFKRYTVAFKVDGNALAAPATPTGDRRLDMGFAIYLYDSNGKVVNSVANHAVNNIPRDAYNAMLQQGLAFRQEVSVPVKGGPYFLRIGVQDQATAHVGAVEIPIESVANLKPLQP